MSADQEKLIRILLQAVQNWWESLRDFAWIIAGLILLALAVIFIGSIVQLIRCSGRLLTWDFPARRRALESISPGVRADN